MTTDIDDEVVIEELPLPLTPRTEWEESMLIVLADTPPVGFTPVVEDYIPEPSEEEEL